MSELLEETNTDLNHSDNPFSQEDAFDSLAVVTGLSLEYDAIWLADADGKKMKLFRGDTPTINMIKAVTGVENISYDDTRRWYTRNFVVPEDMERVLEETSAKVVSERLTHHPDVMYTVSFVRCLDGRVNYHQVCFSKANNGEKLEYFVIAFRDVDSAIRKEQELKRESITDGLTGFYNRRAYEDDLSAVANDISANRELVILSLDVNGLKQVNDSKGHSAGDELLRGAADCISKAFGSYGRLYRIGGDEFAGILYADPDKLSEMREDFNSIMNSWKGQQIESLSVSMGWVSRAETLGRSVYDMVKLADKRMYNAKTAYYSSAGFDRRGQSEAYDILSRTYIKMLRMNLTTDEYRIIQMQRSEQSVDCGFRDTLSAWLYAFAITGQVHEDDLDEYLRETDIEYLRSVFRKGCINHTFKYRRLLDGQYINAMMEILPASDYSDDNQVVYLYVKEI